MIKHYPITNTKKVEELYSEKDGVKVSHVCTTEFGNRYFAVFFKGDESYIGNADQVENLTFGTVENDEGDVEYSRSRHDYKSFKNGNMIDGGRDYIRSSGSVVVYQIKDGEWIHSGVSNDF
jgi:hypothetical protein